VQEAVARKLFLVLLLNTLVPQDRERFEVLSRTEPVLPPELHEQLPLVPALLALAVDEWRGEVLKLRGPR
jgi:hypothetical protein